MGVPHEYGNLSRHGQFLIDRFNIGKGGEVHWDEYFDTVIKYRTTPNGVFGIKAHFNQALPLYQSGFLLSYFKNIKHVFIQRQDVLGQAISLVIASQTGKWTSHEKMTKEPVYSRDEIDNAVKVTNYFNDLWEQLFTMNKIRPCRVLYEELLARPTEEIQRVMSFVGVDTKVSIKLEDAGLKREATSINQEWRERFNAGQ